MQKLALKRLTASDLTFFLWHYKNRNAGNQKAVNLNADIFIDKLYPALPGLANESGGRFLLEIYLCGPGLAGAYNLPRKIIKIGSYKNWRLNGEFVPNPEEEPDRFNVLEKGDIVIMAFEGMVRPSSVTCVFLAKSVSEDVSLIKAAETLLGSRSMVELTAADLDRLILRAAPDILHPVRALPGGKDLEDVALGSAEGRLRIFKRGTGRPMSLAALRDARQASETTGRQGEELLMHHLSSLKEKGIIKNSEWISDVNAIAPYDFRVHESDDQHVLLDAKSTCGDFSRPIHISTAELLTMKDAQERYDICRIYNMEQDRGMMRVAKDMRSFAQSVLNSFATLKKGVSVDGISVDPTVLSFGEEIRIAVEEEGEED